MATTSMSDPREKLRRSIEGIEQILAGETNPERRRIWEDTLFEKQMQMERLQGKPWSDISGLRYGPPPGSALIPSVTGYGISYDAVPRVGSLYPGDTAGAWADLKVDVKPDGTVKVTNKGPSTMFTDDFISRVESGETPVGEAKAEIAHSKREKGVKAIMDAEDEVSRRYGTPTPRDEYLAATKAFQAEKAAIPEKAPTKANLGDINVDDPYDPTGKRAKAGIAGVDFSGKFSRALPLGLGLGIGAALAPEEAWAAPFSQDGLNYWGGAATGLDLGKAAADPSRLSPFSIGATMAEDVASGLGQMIGSGLDTSQVGADIQPDYGMGGGIVDPSRLGLETRAGPDLPQGYDLSGQTPSLAGTQTGMPVAMDAGGAVPAPVVDYSQMAQDWGDPTMMSPPAAPTGVYDLSDPTGGLAATDPNLQGITPTSMAQVGGIPSGRTFGVPTSTDLYSEAGVPMSNENLPWFGAAPVPTSPSMKDVDYSAALDAISKVGLSDDLSREIQRNYEAYRDSYGQPVEHTDPYSSVPDWSWGEIVAPLAGIDPAHFDRMRVLDKLSSTGALDVPSKHTMDTYTHALKSSDLVSSGGNKALAFALGIPGLFTASIPQTVGHYAGLYGETMPNLSGVIDEAVEKNVLNPYGFENPLATSALASPTITAQDQVDAYNAASMGEIASHPGQGGYIGDTERTIGEHLAAVDERVQAMPAVTTPQALAVQDERQQAMPEVSVPAPTAPTVASQAAQNRLAQQQADAAIARAAQAAAARDAARQAQAASAAQAQAAQNAARAVLASAAGRDRGGPSQREINAAREVLSQIDTFDSGGMMTDTQRAMTDVGYGGGFAAGRGDTGATGQGGWT